MANITRMNVMLTANTKGLTSGLSNAEGSIASFASKANARLSSLGSSFGKLNAGIGKFTGMLSTGITKFGNMAYAGLTRLALGATAAAGGLVYLTKSSIDAIGDANDFAKSIGISYNALRTLQKAAQMSGVDLATMNVALMKMSDVLGTAFGGNQAAIESFTKIGLSVESLSKMNPEQQFLAIAEAINRIQDPSQKIAAARDIFGRSGGALISFFQTARDDIASAQKAIDVFGGKLSQLEVEKIDEAGDAMGRLGMIAEGVGNQLANGVAAYIIQAEKDTQKWLKSMGGIDDIVKGGLTRMGNALQWILDKMVYVQAAWREMKDILSAVAGVFDMLPESIKRVIKAAATWNPIRDALASDLQKHADDINREHSGVAGFRDRVGQFGRGAVDAQSQAAQDRVQSDHDKRREARIAREREQARNGIAAQRAGEGPVLSPSQQRAQQIIQGAQNRGVMPSGPLNQGRGPRERNYWERMGIPDPRLPAQMNSTPGASGAPSQNTASEDTNLLRQIASNTGKNTLAYAG